MYDPEGLEEFLAVNKSLNEAFLNEQSRPTLMTFLIRPVDNICCYTENKL
jgi:hypothetical protein